MSAPAPADGSRRERLWWWHSALAVAAMPRLWVIALVELRAMTGRDWWRRRPHVPLPAREWMEFRMETAYGDRRARPSPEDTIAWLEWCRTERQRTSS